LKYANKFALSIAALLATVALVACGGNGEEESEAVGGQFKPLPGAPAGDKSVAGEASLERADGGTTVSLKVTGLEPGTEYVAHLHTGGCGQADPGGPHFKFNAEDSDEPPNEIHLEFRSRADGAGTATASSDREVPAGEAGSVVIHEAEGEGMASTATATGEGEAAAPTKIACAELEGGHSHDSSGEESASRGGEVPTVVVRDGEPVGGIAELEYDAGDEVRFEVESDVADEVHVHGYDLMQDMPAGGSVSFDFPAEIEGIFEVELEGRGEQIAELRVNP
jgi:plastocyanin